MSIVTISRGSYSRGKEVAEALAKELGYQCLSREILLEASEQFNIPEIKLIKALHDAPSVLDRFNNGQERYISYFKTSFLSRMAKGNIIYHGLAGHFFLQDIPHVLKVRINVRMEERINREMEREDCNRDKALYNLRKDDEERRKWSLQLHGKDTWDSRLYDMVLGIDTLTVDDVVEVLATTVRKKQFQETAQSVAALEERVLLANIEAKLLTISPGTKLFLRGPSTLELSRLSGKLKNDQKARDNLTSEIKGNFNIEKVVYREPVFTEKGHVNTFLNLDVH